MLLGMSTAIPDPEGDVEVAELVGGPNPGLGIVVSVEGVCGSKL